MEHLALSPDTVSDRGSAGINLGWRKMSHAQRDIDISSPQRPCQVCVCVTRPQPRYRPLASSRSVLIGSGGIPDFLRARSICDHLGPKPLLPKCQGEKPRVFALVRLRVGRVISTNGGGLGNQHAESWQGSPWALLLTGSCTVLPVDPCTVLGGADF